MYVDVVVSLTLCSGLYIMWYVTSTLCSVYYVVTSTLCSVFHKSILFLCVVVQQASQNWRLCTTIVESMTECKSIVCNMYNTIIAPLYILI